MAIPTTPSYFSLLLASLLAPMSDASAQVGVTTAPLSEGRLLYIGDSAQLSVGLSHKSRLHGELSGVLHETVRQAWLGELWGSQGEGGIKLSHHQHNTPDSVLKLFVAIDQNKSRDRKLTLGYGQETSSWFGQVTLSQGLTGKRLIGQQETSADTQNIGQAGGQHYLDFVTTTTQTRLFEKAYDHGIGLRMGQHIETHNIRLSAGLDHEWGLNRAKQNTASLLVEKMYPGTPHSVALQLSQAHKTGPTEPTRNDSRGMLIYRFSLGRNNAQPERSYQLLPATHTAPALQPPPQPAVAPAAPTTRIEKQWVKTKAIMNADAFFEFDSAKLTPLAQAELQRIATLLQAQGREGPMLITGHTCDIGSDKVNDRLSLVRAQAVKNHLITLGAMTAEDTQVQGQGKRAQKYPATPATRAKNRRVELEFFSFVPEEKLIEVTIPAPQAPAVTPAPAVAPVVTYERVAVPQPPAWIQRALRAPIPHNRTVSVYRIQEQTQTQSTRREWINQAPQAQNDQYTLQAGSTTALNVLDNDRDPDANDTLRLVNVTTPNRGQVAIAGRQIIYTAQANQVGTDNFSYTIEDNQGMTSTAQVSITLTPPPHVNQAPRAQNDQYTVESGNTTALNVLDNDTDPDPDDIITLDSVSAPTQGQVSLQGRQIIYRSQTNQVGSDTFNYSIKDKLGLTSTAQVIITLTQTTPVVKPEPAPNRTPQANADRFGVSGKVPSSLAVLSNDTDPDGDKLTITNVNQPIANSGKVEIVNNSIQFTPNYPFMVDWFTYSISDGRGGSSSATVQLIDP